MVGADTTAGTEHHALGAVVFHLVGHPWIMPGGRSRRHGDPHCFDFRKSIVREGEEMRLEDLSPPE
jgi:hypothetical protein